MLHDGRMAGLPGSLGGKTCNHVEPGPARPPCKFLWAAGHLRLPVHPLYSAIGDAAWPHKVHYVKAPSTVIIQRISFSKMHSEAWN